MTAVAGLAISQVPEIAVRLGRHDAVWVLVALPFGWFVGVFSAVALGINPPDIAATLAVFSTAGGMLLGLILVVMSRTRYADATLEETTESAEREARWPYR